MATGSAGVQAIGLLAAPITARIFEPAATGVSAVFLNLVAICSGVAFLRYEQALPLPRTVESRAVLFRLCLSLLPITIGLLFLAVLFGRRGLADLLNEPSVGPILWLLPAGAALSALTQVLSNWFTREGAFPVIVRSRFRQSGYQIAFQLGFGAVTNGNPWVLAWGSLIGNVIAIASFLPRFPSALWRKWPGNNRAEMIRSAQEFRQFPMYNSWSTLVDLLAPTAPVFVLTSLHGSHTAGLYRLAQLILILPVGAVANAILNVCLGDSARLAHENPVALRHRYRKLTLMLSGCGIALVAGSFVLPWIVPIVFGQRWAEAGVYATVMSVGAALALVSTPAVNLSILGYNHWEAAWIVSRIALIGLATWICHAAHFSPLQTLAAFTAVMVIGYLALIVLNFTAIRCYILRRAPARPTVLPASDT